MSGSTSSTSLLLGIRSIWKLKMFSCNNILLSKKGKLLSFRPHPDYIKKWTFLFIFTSFYPLFSNLSHFFLFSKILRGHFPSPLLLKKDCCKASFLCASVYRKLLSFENGYDKLMELINKSDWVYPGCQKWKQK